MKISKQFKTIKKINLKKTICLKKKTFQPGRKRHVIDFYLRLYGGKYFENRSINVITITTF